MGNLARLYISRASTLLDASQTPRGMRNETVNISCGETQSEPDDLWSGVTINSGTRGRFNGTGGCAASKKPESNS